MKIFCCLLLCFCSNITTKAQSFELQQLILDIEKLSQLKSIYKDVVKGYEILTEGYDAVKDISQGNFNLHQLFLDSLLKVNPIVAQYYKVEDIINCELKIVSEYKTAYDRFKQDDNFSVDELNYLGAVYNNLIDESIEALNDLTNVITDDVLRSSDAERLQSIDKLDEEMKNRLVFLRYFNNNTTVLALQRAREKNDLNTIRNIYDFGQ